MSGIIVYDDTSTDPNATGDQGAVNFGGATLGNSFTTPNSAITLTSLQFLLSENNSSDSSTALVTLHNASGDGGRTPDPTQPASLVANLGTFSASDVSTAFNNAGGVAITYTFSPTSSPTLAANTRYWIELSDADGSSGINWEYTSVSNGDPQASEYTYSSGVEASNSTGPQIMKVSANAISPACFASGTRILTASGEVAVERLQPGDLIAVMGEGSCAPMRWLGHRRVDCRRHPRPHDVWPIHVAADAFGPGQPVRELVLSPDHAVFVADPALGEAGGLVPIRYLLNGATIRQVATDAVTYFHVELDRHDILFADGLAAESYLDTGNRCAFANGGNAVMAHPDFARQVWAEASCAPLLLEGPVIEAWRARLHTIAEAAGFVITADPDLHLIVDGVRVEASERRGSLHIFDCEKRQGGASAAPRQVSLGSRSGVPCELRPDIIDARRLGVAVAQIVADGVAIPTGAGAGWHDPEDGWQWTNGMADLACSDALRIEVTVAMAAQYWLACQAEAAAPIVRAA